MCGLIRPSAVVVPALLVAAAALIKGAVAGLLSLVFGIRPETHLLDERFWIETAYNVVLAPPLFALLNRIRLLRTVKRPAAP